jgi:hypothetical protein
VRWFWEADIEEQPNRLHYRAGRSVVTVSGSVTTVESTLEGAPPSSPVTTSKVDLLLEADPRLELLLKSDESFWNDKKFDLKFAGDGRLISTSSVEAGSGAAILEAGVRIATFAAGVAVRLAAFGASAVQDGKPRGSATAEHSIADEAYAKAYPAAAGRRQALKASLGSLVDSLARASDALATSMDPSALYAARARCRAIQEALEAVRKEAAVTESVFDAWLATTQTTSTTDYTFVLRTLDLLTDTNDADVLKYATADDIQESQRALAQALNVIVTLDHDPLRPPAGDSLPDDLPLEGFYVRVPRPVVISAYETTDDRGASPRTFHRKSRRRLWVIDEHSDLDFIGSHAHLFDKHTATLSFGDSGSLTKVGIDETSQAKGVAGGLSAGVAQVKATLDDTVKVFDDLSKLRSGAASDRLTALKQEKEELEAKIAQKGLLATAADREKLAVLKEKADEASTLKQLTADAEVARQAQELSSLKDKLAKAKAQLELEKTEADLEKLSASK